jgi:hypothetical protein
MKKEVTMKSFGVSIVALLFILSCAVTKVPVATGGSRADGTIVMAFQYGGFDKPQVDWSKAAGDASQRCGAWGYTSAEPFGGYKTTCRASNQYGCVAYLVEVTYQCIGKG